MFLITMAIAAMLNAFMDTILYRIDRSIFKHKNVDVWNPMRSGYLTKSWMGWMRFDPWHIAKLGMIAAFIGTAVLFRYFPLIPTTNILSFAVPGWLLDAICLGIDWFVTFELFWGKIFYVKTKAGN